MDDYIKRYLAILALFMVVPQSSMAQLLWSDVAVADKNASAMSAVSVQAKTLNSNPHIKSRRVSVDYTQLKSTLAVANASSTGTAQKQSNAQQIDLPMPYGGLQTFNVSSSSVMAPELAAKYPQIKTYKVVATNDPTVTGVLDTGSKGFHAYLHTAEGEVFIDPASVSTQQEYYSYYKHDYANIAPREFSCGVKPKSETESPVAEFKNAELVAAARTSGNMISYRIAVAATTEYSQAVKDPSSVMQAQIKADVLAEIVTAITRVNQVYERDLAIRLILIANNDQIIFTDADPGPDPYSNPANASLLLDENQATLDNVIYLGANNYDIGHVFSTEGGGLAGLGVACMSGYKARGETGHPNPVGDPFYIDFVAHELGHQLGAEHSFNGTTDSCGYNRNAATAFEPGSGSTIMGYAGICGAESTSLYSVAAFHSGSIAEIVDYTRLGSGNTCPASINEQQAPSADAKLDYTIPGGTAFTLTGLATDPENDVMTYQWDQMDAGTSTTASTHGTDNGSNALFRSFEPVATAERTFPQLATLLGNNPDALADKAETLPTENRTLNFRFTARDGNGGVDEDDMQVIVDGDAGPFEVRQPNTNVILTSLSPQLIEWNTACTDIAPVNCANVDILLSTDGGQNFTSVAGGTTPNDGNQLVVLPSGNTTTARIKIACADNIFFDISNVDFEINDATGGSLAATGATSDCGTATGVGNNTGDEIEPNNFPAQAQTLTFPSLLNGSVNDKLDPDDYFVFVANQSSYSFEIFFGGGHDLDLYLLDSTGNGIIAESSSYDSPTETITQNLLVGETYYIVVNGWDTSSLHTAYNLDVQENVASSSSGGGGVASYYWLFMMLITPLLRLSRRD